jgi:hypothetical protein
MKIGVPKSEKISETAAATRTVLTLTPSVPVGPDGRQPLVSLVAT